MKRIEYLDAIKGFSVLWVVLYHFALPGEVVNAPLRLPLFFLISGFFFRERSCFKDFIIKKINTLLIPFIFFWIFGVCMRFFYSVASYMLVGEFNFSLKSYFIGFCKLFTVMPVDAVPPNPLGVGAIWFLIGLFCLQMIYYGLLRISRNRFFLIFVAFLAYFLSYYLLDNVCAFGSLLYIPYILRFLVYYVCGHIWYGNFLSIVENSGSKIRILVTMIIAFLLTVSLKKVEVQTEELVCMWLNHFLLLVETLFFTGIVTLIFRYIYHWRIVQPFTYFGKNSIVVFATHMAIMPFVITLVSKIIEKTINIWGFVALAFPVILSISYLITKLFLQYIPFFIGKEEIFKYKIKENNYRKS